MEQTTTSVIVPVYNAEKYIKNCIQSIVNQTYPFWELILIDDGSLDNSGTICDEYAAKEPRIKVIHQYNQGVSSARKTGFEKSTGEWICFVDADDIIANDYIEKLVSNNSNVDIVHAHMQNDQYISAQEYISLLLKNNTYNGPVYKLFHRNLISIDCFKFPQEINHGEDTLMNIVIALRNTKKIKCIKYKGYYYLSHSTGLASTHKASIKYEDKYYEVLQSLFSPSQKKDFFNDLIAKRYWRLYELIMYYNQGIDRHSKYWKQLRTDTQESKIKLEPYQLCIYYIYNNKILKLALKIIKRFKLLKLYSAKL